ncbi:hypothetical protein E8E11_007025 [Didymella keratinophila]|nr:hypothetical protein E8E11_007025 [Didymella keratinophila]
MASPQKENTHWLDRYATGFHAWTSITNENGQTTFTRPLGLVETSFDSDGVYYGGRADMTGTLTIEVKHSLSKEDLRRRIALAWTALRLRHVLLMSRHFDDPSSGLRRFAIDVPKDLPAALHDVEQSTIWIEDHYASVDIEDFHDHALNVNRIIEPRHCMSKLHVLPLHKLPGGTYQLSFLIIMAHQVSDGLSAYGWFKDLIRLLNAPVSAVEAEIISSLDAATFRSNLPLAQEDLYPRIAGNRARQRWIWAIVRVLRHVKHTLPPTFTNPLYREQRLAEPRALKPTYAKVFAYEGPHMPPMSTGHIVARLSHAASLRLITLCREARLSIGAGCFALVGLAMMHIHAQRYPRLTAEEMPAMTASFPLNPRAFFSPPPPAESCMLSFSDGIVMPFPPCHLPLEKRFVQTARAANRELKMYQKRLRTTTNGQVSAGLDRHSPARLLATGYVAQIERVQAKLPSSRRSRAREGEFLVGSSTDAEGHVGFGVSYDANVIEPEAAEMWARTITGLLEREARL